MADDTLYDQLIAPMENKMMRTIWRVLRRNDLAEDTLQDALAIIWAKRERVRRHPNPPALILRICMNCAYDTLRRERLRAPPEPSSLSWQQHTPENASRAMERKEIEVEVLNAISRLSRKQAQAILMRVIDGEDYPVIAQAMNCSETTVRIHVSRARRRLSRWLSHLKTVILLEERRNER